MRKWWTRGAAIIVLTALAKNRARALRRIFFSKRRLMFSRPQDMRLWKLQSNNLVLSNNNQVSEGIGTGKIYCQMMMLTRLPCYPVNRIRWSKRRILDQLLFRVQTHGPPARCRQDQSIIDTESLVQRNLTIFLMILCTRHLSLKKLKISSRVRVALDRQ